MNTSVLLSLSGFTLAALVLTLTPGLDTALVLRTAAAGSGRAAVFSALGIVVGCLAWAVAVAVGLGALLIASRIAFDALRWVGAAYLCYLGLGLILRPRSTFEVQGGAIAESARGAFLKGTLTNVLNPKVGLFYLTFLPQFVPAGVDVVGFTVLLGAIHAVLGLMWFAVLIGATRAISAWLQRGRIVRALDRLTGGIFLLFSLRLATAARG
jgi:threonine/homoserine/homoserine lactone efflux protein